jgi:hypothetical protein
MNPSRDPFTFGVTDLHVRLYRASRTGHAPSAGHIRLPALPPLGGSGDVNVNVRVS